ncbi:hypothetical protein [Reinekea sp.]|jgi:hypothetical protein|uniref:hypothetical protein n=1 Tax=Reinekea sp. TaxID=1970455 RepID=UPI0039890DF4
MTQSVKSILKSTFYVSLLGMPALAAEFGVDGSFASSPIVNAWGIGTHAQIISDQGVGLDLGVRYFNDLTYTSDSYGVLDQDAFTQLEIAGLKQWGDKGVRVQVLAGGLFSGTDVATSGGTIIEQYDLGYRVDAGISVPVFTHFRAFAEGGYQAWPSTEMPGSMRWRYGLRLNFGGNDVLPLEAVEKQQAQEVAEKEAQELANPSMTIDTRVPQYIPNNMSESLPPIIELAELCKCFPAGPYTLQLGEFKNMNQAIRSLEYRGLRQFFNSRAFQKNPLPVFLAEVDDYGAVAIFLGEVTELTELRYWRHELKKNGLSARLRKVVGTNGERVDNPMMAFDPAFVEPEVTYTAEEVARMNSLPGDSGSNVVDVEAINRVPTGKAKPMVDAVKANAVQDKKMIVNGYVQVGPLPMSQLLSLIETDSFKRILGRDETLNLPVTMAMDWDETRQEAWLNFSGFESTYAQDIWLTMFEAQGYAARSLNEVNRLLGDIYGFTLGAEISKYSVEIERSASNIQILESLRSPEVLWFEAYQRINERPVTLSLNWFEADSRYRIVVANVKTKAEQTQIWTSLSAVGLMPSLAEQ